MNKMNEDYGGTILNRELLGLACKAMNTQQRFGGYSPSQLVMGHEPDVGVGQNPAGLRREVTEVHRLQQL